MEAFKLLSRLLLNSRMKAVWHELQKRKAGDRRKLVHAGGLSFAAQAKSKKSQAKKLRSKGPSYEANAQELEVEAEILERLPVLPENSQWTDHEQALGFLFHQVFWHAMHPIPTVSLSNQSSLVKELNAIAEDLAKQAAKLISLGITEDAILLKEVARNCEEQALWCQPDANEVGVVQRYRHDRLINGYLVWTAHCTQTLFGSPLYSTLATITNVAFGLSYMTGPKVRAILRTKQ